MDVLSWQPSRLNLYPNLPSCSVPRKNQHLCVVNKRLFRPKAMTSASYAPSIDSQGEDVSAQAIFWGTVQVQLLYERVLSRVKTLPSGPTIFTVRKCESCKTLQNSPSVFLYNSPKIIKPVRGGIDVLLLFFPGALTPPQAYFPLIDTIQKNSKFRLWATILDPGKRPISSPMIEASFDGMIKRAKGHGFESGELSMNRIFVAGHSVGAWCSRIISKKKAEGFIQMGSFFHTNPDNLAQYPKPVLSLGGGLDGQLRVGGMAKHAGEIHTVEPEMGDFNTNAVKPVIIIPGMNHAQFSHGIPNKERGDLDAHISLEDARSQIAESIISFLTLHIEAQDETRQLALENLSKGVKKTYALYKTFWEAIENQERQAKVWQLQVAGLQELIEEDVVVIKHDYLDNFVYSKPWIDTKGKHIFVQIYSSPADKFGIVKNIWIKMKSYDAIHELLGKSDKQSKIVSAADFNAETFHEALSLTPEVSRRKFYESGKKMRFIEDCIITTSGQDWADSDVIMKPAEDGSDVVDVQSTVVITPVHGIASRFAGMHYMKLLSVARCMEWILLDSFR